MEALRALEAVIESRWSDLADDLPGPTPRHDVRFSARVTNAWALIYFKRRRVRLSPFLFLLEPDALHHGSYWRELDATLKHEVVHAHLFAATGETGHTPRFHELLDEFGVRANGERDLGPENATFRYVYRCGRCGIHWRRRAALQGTWSCGRCHPGAYSSHHRMELVRVLPPPSERLLAHEKVIWATVDEAYRRT